MTRWWAGDMVPLGRGLGPAAGFVAALPSTPLDGSGSVHGRSRRRWWRPGGGAMALAPAGGRHRRLPLAAELLMGAVAQRYPLLDERTSLFFTTLLTVCGALGIAAMVAWSARRWGILPLGVALAVAAGALLVPAAHSGAIHPMPPSSIRQQVSYVLAHRQPGDVVVVGSAASFAFAYYWPERPTFAPTTVITAVRFQVEYPGRRDLVLVRSGRRPDLIPGALREAAARSSSGRIWLVLAEAGDRNPAWAQAMARTGWVVRRRLPRLVVVDPDVGRR